MPTKSLRIKSYRSWTINDIASDVHISAWTVNDASVVRNLFDMGVDSVITDYPSMAVPLVSYLAQA